MRKAWTALSALALVASVGCQEDPEPVSQVPGPAPYDSSYDNLGPVAIDQGQQPVAGYNPGPAAGQYDGGTGNASPGVPGVGATPGGTYVIQKGDTLWSIASRVYGDGQKHVDIVRANPGLNPQRLAIGQEIVLP
ncbi:MAG: LysM peptidoglycan-binding domain-containing protein [Phycisphaerales bacterium JB063]